MRAGICWYPSVCEVQAGFAVRAGLRSFAWRGQTSTSTAQQPCPPGAYEQGLCLSAGPARDPPLCSVSVRVWDVRNGDIVAGPFKGHTNRVTSVAFSPNGTSIASGSKGKDIRIWDLFSPAVHASQPLGDWLLDEAGMVTTRQGQLLLHVPVDLHIGLLRPQNPACIHEHGFLALHFDGVLLGRDWVKCYRS
jgi:hypothetical protein